MTLDFFVQLALTLPATIFALGEKYCGEFTPIACVFGAITSSGTVLDPSRFQAAVPAPNRLFIHPRTVSLTDANGNCFDVQIIDRKNPRYVGKSGLDVTPAVVTAITGELTPSKRWGGRLLVCNQVYTEIKIKEFNHAKIP